VLNSVLSLVLGSNDIVVAPQQSPPPTGVYGARMGGPRLTQVAIIRRYRAVRAALLLVRCGRQRGVDRGADGHDLEGSGQDKPCRSAVGACTREKGKVERETSAQQAAQCIPGDGVEIVTEAKAIAAI
jgi:hypothetical protein